ncbi:MAG: alpha/beta hydrolase [candidate division KSB1 bacterium]|nr:alpha/beta hydrolase [candidate division KSB1 bacterium]MDZ7273907.1 alpha/beta hydrolase [candidate division KSB1 bacterium]MDZ7286063.1 alpha/beta hydrolase [candidate division KSB1 bacterium]MDZ7299095.1 alpha/beta hydrolase [candidate division KSB1 bacterium]MDZ7306398.1 alpha/beta hydrolase [candidate division KSB1 bacterium]
MTPILEHHHLLGNGVRLHVAHAGPENGRLLLFLHGFPEFWYAWHRQIDFFARLGYRVLAPDQRGYNLSDKPRGIAAYRLDQLARDIAGLIQTTGRQRALIVGHDWGAVVAWWLALQHADCVEKLAVLNGPHPRVMRRYLLHDAEQRRKSWYIFFFQLPGLPEWRMRKNNWEVARRTLLQTSRPGTFSQADLEKYCAAWSQPGAATAMINWYRAALRHPPGRAGRARVQMPTLVIWGGRDRFLRTELAQASLAQCQHGELFLLENASHWVQHEQAQTVNQRLQQFFTA